MAQSTEQLQKLAQDTFKAHPGVTKVLATADGNIFLPDKENLARLHASQNKLELQTIERPAEETIMVNIQTLNVNGPDVADKVADVVANAAKVNKPAAATKPKAPAKTAKAKATAPAAPAEPAAPAAPAEPAAAADTATA